MFSRSLVLFRRDLRLADHPALTKAVQNSKEVVLAVVFDPRQFSDTNAYKGVAALDMFVRAVADVRAHVTSLGGRLHIFCDDPVSVLRACIKEHGVDAVFVHEDVTPFSAARDEALRSCAHELNASFIRVHGLFLTRPGSVRTQNDDPYTVYTPFYKRAIQQSVPKPLPIASNIPFASLSVSDWEFHHLDSGKKYLVEGSREEGLRILERISAFHQYAGERDYPSLHATTHLSTHHKFGTISVRETYHAVLASLGPEHTLIKELYWRDFFSHVAHSFPHVFGSAFQEKYRLLDWSTDESLFLAWCDGRTGYPIVDAGMRELNATGYMHNRVRMIVASFLTKHLRIDWRLGERYFAQKLIDYDPAVNNGNWQWAASTGVDAQPYFRVFNPWTQGKRFDVDGAYIKKWVPELSDLSASFLHEEGAASGTNGYPQPLVDHATARRDAIEWFKNNS